MSLIQKKQITPDTAYAIVVNELEKARYDLALAYDNFENAMEPDLIDCCIYQVNALQMRYKFLLTKAKQLNPEPSYAAKTPLGFSEPQNVPANP